MIHGSRWVRLEEKVYWCNDFVSIYSYNASTRELVFILEEFKENIHIIAFNTDGRLLTSGRLNDILQLRGTEAGQQLTLLKVPVLTIGGLNPNVTLSPTASSMVVMYFKMVMQP